MTEQSRPRHGRWGLPRSAVLGLGLCALVACSSEGSSGPGGDGDGGSGGDGDGDGDGNDSQMILDEDNPGGVALTCDREADLAATPLLKLSTKQYRNTIHDLLALYQLDDAEVDGAAASIPDDALGESFRGLDDRIELSHVQGFFQVGVAIGDQVASNTEALESVVGDCATDEIDEDCFGDFLDGFMESVYRRPLSDEERDEYLAIFDENDDPVAAVRAAIIVAVSSPRFLYHVEVDGQNVGNADDLLTLDAYEVASRLSYTFWQTMPDDELMEAARDGSLLDEDVYADQLERIWEDERTEETIAQFWAEWLRLEKFTGFETSRPAFIALSEGYDFQNHDYYADMVEEVLDLTKLFTFQRPAPLSELLTSNLSVTQSSELAELYGVEPWDGEGDYPSFEPGERAGLLQRGALLVSNLEQTNPFHRGALVRRAILCDNLPQPDPNELPPGSLDPPPVDEAQTTRERFSAKVEGNGLCEECHNTFSNIGYVMESFDALGRNRTVEQVFDEQNGDMLAELPIDTVADVSVGSDPVEVSDAAELNQMIVDSGKVEACLAENYFAFFARRAFRNSSLDRCVVDDLSETLADQDGGLQEAFQRMARVSTFFTKKVGPQ